MTDDNSRKSAITTIVTFVLLNIIWTGALTSAADQHLISPNSDIVTEYRFDGPDILGKEIPFHVFYEINEVEGMGSSEVTIELQLSDGTIIEVYSGISNASSTETYALLPGPSSFLITIKQDGQIYPVPSDIVEKEKSIEMGRDDLGGKPQQMKEKIVQGRITKRLKELALMEQPFIRDSSITVEELVKQIAGKIGENVKVRRFTRYTLGEGIEVEKEDFASEVASMTSA